MDKRKLKKWSDEPIFKHWIEGGGVEVQTKGSKKWEHIKSPKWNLTDQYRIYPPANCINIYALKNKQNQMQCTDLTTLEDAKERVTDFYLYTIHYTEDGIELLNLKQ